MSNSIVFATISLLIYGELSSALQFPFKFYSLRRVPRAPTNTRIEGKFFEHPRCDAVHDQHPGYCDIGSFHEWSKRFRRFFAAGTVAIGTLMGSNDPFAGPFPNPISPSPVYAAASNHELFDEVWKLVNENFYDDTYNNNDWMRLRDEYRQRLDSGADEQPLVRKMLSLLGDKYTRLLDRGTYEGLWKYDAIGVGALFQTDPGKRMRIAGPPLPGSAAAKAGLQQGDEILSINGKSTDSMSAVALLDLMSNDFSDTVTLEYSRPSEMVLTVNEKVTSDSGGGQSGVIGSVSTIVDERNVAAGSGGESSVASSIGSTGSTDIARSDMSTKYSVTVFLKRSREHVSNPISYFVEKLPDGKLAGYIRLADFNAEAVPRLQAALAELNRAGAQEVVLDLRGNTGGGFQFALNIGGMFMRDKVMATATGRDSATTTFRTSFQPAKAEQGGVLYRGPLVLLTDALSASASEVLTAGLRDNCRAVVAGQRTFGKGKIQAVFGLSDGEGLTMTVAQYLTPKGTAIQGRGIEPDLPLPTLNPYLRALGATAVPLLGPVAQQLTHSQQVRDLRSVDFEAAEKIIRRTCTQEFLDQTRDTLAPIL